MFPKKKGRRNSTLGKIWLPRADIVTLEKEINFSPNWSGTYRKKIEWHPSYDFHSTQYRISRLKSSVGGSIFLFETSLYFVFASGIFAFARLSPLLHNTSDIYPTYFSQYRSNRKRLRTSIESGESRTSFQRISIVCGKYGKWFQISRGPKLWNRLCGRHLEFNSESAAGIFNRVESERRIFSCNWNWRKPKSNL